MFGYISAKELEHGLTSAAMSHMSAPCTFKTSVALMRGVSMPASRITTPSGHDFSWLIETYVLYPPHRSLAD